MTLAARDLAFGHAGRRVGSGLSLDVSAGQIVCLLGPNGSGKTTLLKTLLGLLPPQGGKVLLDERPLAAWPRPALARRISYVPQADDVFFPFTAREIVLMGRTPHLGVWGAPAADDHARAAAALQTMGIEALADAVFTRLSGGERQLVLIARALAQETGLMLLDEPTAGLDFGNQLRVLEALRIAAAAGTGILFSTHDPDHALLCADRALLLCTGTVLDAGPPSRIITAAAMQTLYGVAAEVATVTLTTGAARRLVIPVSVQGASSIADNAAD